MSPRFKTKELLFLLPIMGIMGFAFYWTRAGSVPLGGAGMFRGDPFSRGIFVESVKFETAPGDKRGQGFSHTLTVTLKHSWPQPKFWNDCCGVMASFDSADSRINKSMRASFFRTDAVIEGSITWKHNGKSTLLVQKHGSHSLSNFKRENGRIVLTHNLALQNVASQGEVYFDGIYTLMGQPAIKVHQVLRKTGGKLMFDTSRITGGHLLFAKPMAWKNLTVTSTPIGSTKPKTTFDDMLDVNLKIQCAESVTGSVPDINIYDVELVDGKKRVYPVGTSNVRWLPAKPTSEKVLSGEYRLSPAIMLGTGSGFRPPNPLTLRGKVSIDHQWPLPFSIKLPPLS